MYDSVWGECEKRLYFTLVSSCIVWSFGGFTFNKLQKNVCLRQLPRYTCTQGKTANLEIVLYLICICIPK